MGLVSSEVTLVTQETGTAKSAVPVSPSPIQVLTLCYQMNQ